MPYEVKKRYTRADGSVCWRVVFNNWTKSVREQTSVKVSDYIHIGLRPEMAYDEAKSVVRSYNAGKAAESRELRILKTRDRLRDEQATLSAYFPAPLLAAFELELPPDGKTRSYWRAAQRVIAHIKIEPPDWRRRAETIYHYLEERETSLSYTKKIIGLMNRWGEFWAYKTGRPFLPLKPPTGKWFFRIENAYRRSSKPEREAAPISPGDLETARSKLKPEHYNFFFITLWLGLRPHELHNTRKGEGKNWFIEKQEGLEVLAIYQTKIETKVVEHLRWKRIPLLFQEQRAAVDCIRRGAWAQPLNKTGALHIKEGVKGYSGRNGFEPLMHSLGRSFMEISIWLGHTSPRTTFQNYREEGRVFLDAPHDKKRKS